MASALTIGLYIGIAALVVILAMGMINLTRTDEGQRSRSNQLMRMRVMVQAAVIGILVLLGIVLGSIKLF
ncbi:MAG: HIG1 domain-containing protein [Pseudomonadota bacterium]